MCTAKARKTELLSLYQTTPKRPIISRAPHALEYVPNGGTPKLLSMNSRNPNLVHSEETCRASLEFVVRALPQRLPKSYGIETGKQDRSALVLPKGTSKIDCFPQKGPKAKHFRPLKTTEPFTSFWDASNRFSGPVIARKLSEVLGSLYSFGPGATLQLLLPQKLTMPD